MNTISQNPLKVNFNWQEVEQDCVVLFNKLKKYNLSYKGIIAVSRGGLAIAAIISKLLDIKLIDTLCVSSYEDTLKSFTKLDVLKEPLQAKQDLGEKWLILDDLIDSGYTYEYIHNIMPKAHFACLYNKSNENKYINNIVFAKVYPKDSWIEFPWETIIIK